MFNASGPCSLDVVTGLEASVGIPTLIGMFHSLLRPVRRPFSPERGCLPLAEFTVHALLRREIQESSNTRLEAGVK